MRKNKKYLFCLILCLGAFVVQAQNFRTETLSSRIQTLRVSVADKWELPPIINLYENNQIEISFDILGVSSEYLTYKIIHCDADWTQSQLSESEYMRGLQNNPLTEYTNSFNTKMDYVHYKFLIPNDDISLQASGNYVVQVFAETGDSPILNACFSIVEPEANIGMTISPVTDKGANSKYQAVSFEINYGNDIKSPVQDLKVYVQQNNRKDNEVRLVKPMNIQNRKAIYDHKPELIFNAGNEYRKFEMITHLNAGLNIEAVEYHAPYYHSILTPDYPRSGRTYSFDEDINGRIFIRNQDAYDSDIEADYQFVHFYIPAEKPFVDDVYILSDAFHNIFDSRSQMEYSFQDKGYVKTAFLKEGYYNYMYITKAKNSQQGETALLEGDYFQTENEYRIMVYARTPGMRYDKLIGVETLQYK